LSFSSRLNFLGQVRFPKSAKKNDIYRSRIINTRGYSDRFSTTYVIQFDAIHCIGCFPNASRFSAFRFPLHGYPFVTDQLGRIQTFISNFAPRIFKSRSVVTAFARNPAGFQRISPPASYSALSRLKRKIFLFFFQIQHATRQIVSSSIGSNNSAIRSQKKLDLRFPSKLPSRHQHVAPGFKQSLSSSISSRQRKSGQLGCDLQLFQDV
jgi:hypothetical protein